MLRPYWQPTHHHFGGQMRTFTAVALSALWIWSARGSRAETVAVPSTSNIYGAGHSGGAATPQPAGGGGGTAPPSIDVLTTAQFGFAGSGSVRFSPSNPVSNNPDGPASASTTFLSFNGVSGFDSDHAFALYGVFVGATEPADPPPPALSFTGILPSLASRPSWTKCFTSVMD